MNIIIAETVIVGPNGTMSIVTDGLSPGTYNVQLTITPSEDIAENNSVEDLAALAHEMKSVQITAEIDEQLEQHGVTHSHSWHFVHRMDREHLLAELTVYNILSCGIGDAGTWGDTPTEDLTDEQLRKIVLLAYYGFFGGVTG